MTTQQLKSAIDNAVNKMAHVDLAGRNARSYVAVYADGSLSPVLGQHTWEGGKPSVVCQVGAWWSNSHSKTRNTANRRAAKADALAQVQGVEVSAADWAAYLASDLA